MSDKPSGVQQGFEEARNGGVADLKDGKKACNALHEPSGTQAADDQSGEPLVPYLVRKAGMEEMAYFQDIRVYEKVDLG